MNLFFLQNATIKQLIKYNHRIFPKKSGFLIKLQNQYSIFEFDGDVKFPLIDWSNWDAKLKSSNKYFEIIEYHKK